MGTAAGAVDTTWGVVLVVLPISTHIHEPDSYREWIWRSGVGCWALGLTRGSEDKNSMHYYKFGSTWVESNLPLINWVFTLGATAATRITRWAGFTTVRGLVTEGAGDADLALRKCISTNIIEGPRYFAPIEPLSLREATVRSKISIHLNEECVEGVMRAEVVNGKGIVFRGRLGLALIARSMLTSIYLTSIHPNRIYADSGVRSHMGNITSEIGSQAISTFDWGSSRS
ncbi:hypothetical protein BD779DRAFT_1785170 [Infundibulicybe gibba]|nr:hypothetical protein BD779DRAFT_1785170 [Infundibulicybe gibba]